MPLAVLASLFWAVQSFTEKRTVSAGISRRDFFYYSCLFLIPFAAIMVFVTPFYFNFNYWLIPIFAGALLFRYGKMAAIVSTMKHLVPYESEAYMCLSVILAYIADCVIGVKFFSLLGVLSITITILGVFLIADVKLKIKHLQKGIIIRILCDVGLAYCTRYALLYCSNALFILLLNLIIVLIFSWKYKLNEHKKNLSVIKLVIIQQFLGFIVLFLGNIVTQQSVTAYSFIRPIELAICILIALFAKNKFLLYGQSADSNNSRSPKIKDGIAIAFIITGIFLQTI